MENDGQFPSDSRVEVRHPGTGSSDRDSWPWLPGRITEQIGSDEWGAVVEVDALAEEDEETGELLYPVVYRDASELRRAAQ